tara:strand:- start:1337 stop:3241 length:1905 start_codon:yes stop_codon:yes gene_type:complete
MKISYKHLIDNIKEKPDISDISRKLFQLGHEHETSKNIFDMELTPNRGDCLSLRGLLRDLRIFYDTEIDNEIYEGDIKKLNLDFENNTPNYCSKISFLKIEIDRIPDVYNDNLQKYFTELDVNKNNFFTDISNYISYETGQPTHCYDASSLGDKIRLDFLNSEYEFMTLLDKKILLEGENLVFFGKDNKVINLAGVIGGKSTSCTNETKSVLIECAYFNPEIIMGKSIKYALTSDAAHKFERNTDPNCHNYVLRRFLKIVEEHTNITNVELFSGNYSQTKKDVIDLDIKKINKVLGTQVSKDECIKFLQSFGFEIENMSINIPTHRHDIESVNDIAEEIARAIGYNNINTKELIISSSKKKSIECNVTKLRDLLIANGFYEVINDPFVSTSNKSSIEVDNPLDSSRKFLRTSLKDSLIKNLIYNERRQKDIIKLFEISDIYLKESDSYKKVIGIIASGRVDKNYRDFTKKITNKYIDGILKNHITGLDNTNCISIERQDINSKSKDSISFLEFEINSLIKVNNDTDISHKIIPDFSYMPISEFPCSTRDLSFSIKDFTKCEPLQNFVLSFKNDLLKDVFIFDYFLNEKNNEIKIGFRFIFQDIESTITETQVNDVMNVIIKKSLEEKSISIPGL